MNILFWLIDNPMKSLAIMLGLVALVFGAGFSAGRATAPTIKLDPQTQAELDKWVDEQMNKEKAVAELPPLTDDEFKQVQEYFREQKRLREKNRPAPQGDYQWDGGYSFNGGFGEYQALFFKGKKIGGMFAPGSSYPNEYHRFSEDGGVYSEKTAPPVEHKQFEVKR